ncbi:MAG: universal stress protein [Desulfosalsimonadaceae bacterium]
MEIRKVLWPTDFSSSAQAALPYVKSLGTNHDAEIHVLHVIEDIVHHEGWYGEFDGEHIEKLMEKTRKKAGERLDQICERYLEGCRLFIKHVATGDPAAEILKFIKNENIDSVVMAKEGKSGNFSFGSITERVVKHSPVPVTVIPTEK